MIECPNFAQDSRAKRYHASVIKAKRVQHAAKHPKFVVFCNSTKMGSAICARREAEEASVRQLAKTEQAQHAETGKLDAQIAELAAAQVRVIHSKCQLHCACFT